jgi:hypothetical protein
VDCQDSNHSTAIATAGNHLFRHPAAKQHNPALDFPAADRLKGVRSRTEGVFVGPAFPAPDFVAH